MQSSPSARTPDSPRVLFVDDDERNLLAAQAVLTNETFELVLARSGMDALRALMERDFAVVVLDVMMPELDGLDTARLIRQRKRTRDLPIIFVTAYAQDDKRVQQAYELGAIDFLSKPFSAEILRAKLRVLSRLRPSPPEASAQEREEERLAVLARELRNPVNVMRLGLRALRLYPAPAPSYRGALDGLERALASIHRFVEDALEVAAHRQGQISLQTEDLSVAAVVEAAAESVQEAMSERGHHFSLLPPQTPVRLHADFDRLVQATSELLENAARHTDPGGHIALSFGEQDGHAWIRVQDDGHGIDAALLPQIFSLRSPRGPPAWGLARVRAIATLHEGTATARSDGPGQGSTFELRWPARPAQPARLLVIDDDDDVRYTTVALLRLEGFLVGQASSGMQGIELAAAQRFDLIVMDLGMPELDGYETAVRLRQRLGPDTPPLIAVTGFGTDTARARTREAGFSEHLVKPVDPYAFPKLLWKMIDERRMRRTVHLSTSS